jgi:hypothetical protein
MWPADFMFAAHVIFQKNLWFPIRTKYCAYDLLNLMCTWLNLVNIACCKRICVCCISKTYAENYIVGGVRKIGSGKLHDPTHTIRCTADYGKDVADVIL